VNVDLETEDGVVDAFLARPDGDGPHPAVLFYMDAFGLRPRLDEMAEQIAAQGYVVLVPNVFYRSGRAPLMELPDLSVAENRSRTFAALGEFMRAFTPDAAMRDADAYVDYLSGLDSTDSRPIGVTGYCMGGALSLRTAGRLGDRVAAAASFHGGRLATDAPDSPHLVAHQVKAELYFAHADHDRSMPPEQIARLEGALDEAGVTYQSELYQGAAHGFTMADTSSYNEAATKRHWAALFTLFDRRLKDR
jgi:carboxymethylenebutenolidase